MKKLLVVFVKEFPYGVSEPFLEIEYPLYGEYFDKTLIITNKPKSHSIRGQKTREIMDANIELLESEYNKNIINRMKLAWSVLTDKNFYEELFTILKSRKSVIGKTKSLFSVIGKANMCVEIAQKRINQLKTEGYEVMAAYSYWLLYPAYAAVKMSQKYYSGKLYTVSRAHRFDLYEYRNQNKYLPCRKYILNGLSEIASISIDGKEYLRSTYPDYNMNITLRRLGARDIGIMQYVNNDMNLFRIVSCSRVVPVKRVERIVSSLIRIKDINIEWTHIGGGDLLEDIKTKAEKLPPNIKAIFTGVISNKDVYKKYTEKKFHVFINVSESEGVPVSIMEAMCFGTPVIATNVGGVGEMITPGVNGYLLEEDFNDTDLIERLRQIASLRTEEYRVMRERAREIYEEKYNAISNYRSFLTELSNLKR